MISFEDAIRIHVLELQTHGDLNWRENDLDSQLERTNDCVKLMHRYGFIKDESDEIQYIKELMTINDAFHLASEYTNFYGIIDQMNSKLAAELQDYYNDFPEVHATVLMMQAFELTAKMNLE